MESTVLEEMFAKLWTHLQVPASIGQLRTLGAAYDDWAEIKEYLHLRGWLDQGEVLKKIVDNRKDLEEYQRSIREMDGE